MVNELDMFVVRANLLERAILVCSENIEKLREILGPALKSVHLDQEKGEILNINVQITGISRQIPVGHYLIIDRMLGFNSVSLEYLKEAYVLLKLT